MKKRLIFTCGLLAAIVSPASPAADTRSKPEIAGTLGCATVGGGTDDNRWTQLPSNDTVVTRHRLSTPGRSFEYAATAGTLVIQDDEGRPIANMGYTAYTRSGVPPASRPVLFAFNGGPGSSSVWLHLGLLGPKRIVVNDAGITPPAPVRMVDNEFSILDRADIVLIDPVGTGFSRATCARNDADFWGVDVDAESVGRFIAQYVTDNHRWASPKYLLGESYGTIRAAVVANYLRIRRSLNFNGVILLSVAIDLEAVYTDLPGNDRTYSLFLPGFAAVAWYHNKLPRQRGPLEPFLAEVRRYASGPYLSLLAKGNGLSEAELDAAAEDIHNYTGLSAAYLKAAHLRVSESAFNQELLRSERRTISRLDARYTGDTQDPLQKTADYDPMLSQLGAVYTSAFQDYLRGELNIQRPQEYRTSAYLFIGDKWDYSHRVMGLVGEKQPMVNAGVDLAQTLVQDPSLRVMSLNGYFDVGSPFSASEYMISQMRIPPSAVSRIQMKYYEAGHMMYLHMPSLRQLKRDLDAFVGE